MPKPAGDERPLDLFQEDPQNPRFISDEALAGLEASLEQHGDIAGLTWNERTGQFVAGHQRLVALKRAGATTWRRLDKDRGAITHPKTGELFLVRIVDWSPEQQRIANLVANNPLIAGEFTPAALEQLRALEDQAMKDALRLTDLEQQLRDRFDELEPDEPQDGNTDPDDVPEAPAEAITKPGDLWLLGEHRLLCGDATKPGHVSRLMGTDNAVLMNTDPPYGVAVAGGTHDPRDTKNYRSGGKIENDALTGERLRAFLGEAFSTALPHLAPGAAWYVWYAGTETRAVLDAVVTLGGMKHVLVWVKPNFVFGRSDYHYRHEPAMYGWTPGAAHRWVGSRDQSSVFEAGRDEGPEGIEKKQHPTVKPVALFEAPMRNHTTKGDVCYEPFSGSGSQLIAGERLGRRVFALELEPRYCDVAVLRWQAFTGKTAVRAG